MSVVLTLPILALLAVSGETVTAKFGVASDSHGGACVAIEGHELAEGTVALELSKQVRHARVRSCTSREGVHLSVWNGAPLESTRLMHNVSQTESKRCHFVS